MKPSTRLHFPTCALLALAVIILFNIPHLIDALHHHYYITEPDAYMQMVIANDLLSNHHWFQHLIGRINPPFGSDTHYWTRAIDVLIIPGVLMLQAFMPMKQALYAWCFTLPPLTFFCSTLALLWTINALKPTFYQQLFVVLAFLCNPFLQLLFMPLNVDYNFFTVFLFIVYWGCWLRVIPEENNRAKASHAAIAAAIVAGIGCWASISFFLPVLISMGFLLWLYRLHPDSYKQQINRFLFTLTLCFSALVMVEQKHWFVPAYDILSIVHVVFALLLLLGFNIYTGVTQRRKLRIHLATLLFIAVVIFVTMNYFFPGFYRGPYNQVDPYLLANFFPRISEFFSPFALGNGIALGVLIYFMLGTAFMLYRWQTPHQTLELRKAWIFWAACLLTLLTFYMYRWNNYAGVMNILLMSFFVAYLSQTRTTLTNLILTAFLVFLPTLLLQASPSALPAENQICMKQTYRFIDSGFLSQAQFSHDQIILANTNYTPYLIFNTRYIAIAGNYHHDPEAIRDILEFFNGDEPTARQIALHRKADLLLYCLDEQTNPQAFMTGLEKQPAPPAWLQPLTLPQGYMSLRLYRIVR